MLAAISRRGGGVMIEPPKVLLVVNLRELALMYELSKEASQDTSRHSSDRRTAAKLHADCCELLGRDKA